MLRDKTIESLTNKLCSHAIDDDMAIIEEAYNQLRNSLADTLFRLNNVSRDHYSWLLIDQDARVSLGKFLVAHEKYQATQSNTNLQLDYKRELDNFRWIIITAISCKLF